MRRRLLALAGVGALALALAGCGPATVDGAPTDAALRLTSSAGYGADVMPFEVALPDGSSVTCVALIANGSALSCDWPATTP